MHCCSFLYKIIFIFHSGGGGEALMVFQNGIEKRNKSSENFAPPINKSKTKLSDLNPTCAHEKSSQNYSRYTCDLNIT